MTYNEKVKAYHKMRELIMSQGRDIRNLNDCELLDELYDIVKDDIPSEDDIE